jgi:hypothetical protein
MRKTLTELANQYKSDKGDDAIGLREAWGRGMRDEVHGYSLYYDQMFKHYRDEPIVFVEIGIADWRCPGASLKMWYEYFTQAKIYGYDNFWHELHIAKKESVDPALYENDRTKIFVGDQGERADIARFVQMTGAIDILVEDGSHYPHHQIISLGALFPAIKSGGIYIVEDIQIPGISNGRHNYDNIEALNMLTRFQQTGVMSSEHLLPQEAEYLASHIARIEFIFNVEYSYLMAVIVKK